MISSTLHLKKLIHPETLMILLRPQEKSPVTFFISFFRLQQKTRYQAGLITGLVEFFNSAMALSGPVASFSLPYESSTGN